jgi:hypothetical protein
MKRAFLTYSMGIALIAIAGSGFAADQIQAKDQDQLKAQDQTKTQQQLQDHEIYGYQLMTDKERLQFREKMMTAKTVEEREKIRTEQHAMMQARAKEKGVTLPDAPPARRGGGMGPGAGAGAGGGAGGGGGR